MTSRRVGDFGDAAAAAKAFFFCVGYDDYLKYDSVVLKELVMEYLCGKCEGSGLLVFLYISKTGGTTIETVLGTLGIDVGYCYK